MKEQHQRDFKGVWIPKSIWLNPDLSITEKCLLVEIDSLDNNTEKGCFASNEHLGEFLSLSAGRVANMVVDLKKRAYIVQVFFDGRNRGLRLHEKVKDLTPNLHENVKAGITKTVKLPSRKREHSNTVNNTDKIESAPAQILVTQYAIETLPEPPNMPDAPDWMTVAKQMLEYSRGEGKRQYEFLCESTRFTGDPMPIFATWAGKAAPYELKNWKKHFSKLGTWFHNEAQRKNKPTGYQQAAPAVGISVHNYTPKV